MIFEIDESPRVKSNKRIALVLLTEEQSNAMDLGTGLTDNPQEQEFVVGYGTAVSPLDN